VKGMGSLVSVSAVPSFDGGVQILVTGVLSELMRCSRDNAVPVSASLSSVAGDETRL
jgi:hypothetical protein